MTDEEKLAKLRQMLDETDTISDDVANAYLLAAKQAVINIAFPYGNGSEEMPEKYDYEQIEIAVYMINKRGAEGELIHIEGDTDRHYETADIPVSLRSRITAHTGGF